MTATNGILALVGDPALRDDVDRVAAAVGLPVVHASDPSGRNAWTGAVAVLLDVAAARRCTHRALPRRPRVVLVVRSEPEAADFQAAIAVGAQQVIMLPAHDGELMAELSNAADASSRRGSSRRGCRRDRRPRRGRRLGLCDRVGTVGGAMRCSSTRTRGVAALT